MGARRRVARTSACPVTTLHQWRYIRDRSGRVQGRPTSAVRPGCGASLAGRAVRRGSVCVMASVDPWRWTLCKRCAAAGRTKPGRTEGCRCRITAWRARWRSPEGRDRGKVFARKRDADVHIANVESAKAIGTYVDPRRGRQRFEDFADEWAEGQDWKDTTRESWPYIKARLVPLLGKAQLAAVDQLMLKRVRAALAKEYSHATVKLTMAYAGMIMRAAYTSGRIGRDPTAGPAGTQGPRWRSHWTGRPGGRAHPGGGLGDPGERPERVPGRRRARPRRAAGRRGPGHDGRPDRARRPAGHRRSPDAAHRQREPADHAQGGEGADDHGAGRGRRRVAPAPAGPRWPRASCFEACAARRCCGETSSTPAAGGRR